MHHYANLLDELRKDLGLDEPAPLTSDMTSADAARSLLLASFFKKLCPVGSSSQAAEQAALEKFLGINRRTALWQVPSRDAMSLVETDLWDTFIGVFGSAVTTRDDRAFDLQWISEHMDVGPGAAQKANAESFVSKMFESPLSYYEDYNLSLYRSAVSLTGLWADAEFRRHQKFGEERVPGGKLFFVNKTTDISRTCCTEANVEMLIQKSIGAYFESCLISAFGISLDTQPDINRRMAVEGSLSGSFGTTDLVSASDSVAVNLVRALPFPGFLKGVLMSSAGHTLVLPDGGTEVKGMISTMGNGFTFPLQTLIFACAVKAVYITMGLPIRDPLGRLTFGVFGDDIVVRHEAYHCVNSFLEMLGFEVNDTKSFNSGPFRESCGSDAFNGTLVRGVYIQDLTTCQDVCSAINRLARWSATHKIALPRTLAYLKARLGRFLPVPPSCGDDEGIHMPMVLLHRVHLTDQYWFSYRYWKRKLRRVEFPSDLDADTLGVGVAALSGRVRRKDSLYGSGPVEFNSNQLFATVRERAQSPSFFKIARAEIPYWDYIPKGSANVRIVRDDDRWDDWKIVLSGLIS